MAKFNTGQSFADGDTVTGAKLNNIASQLNIYTGVISEQTAMVATVSTADQLLIADVDNGDSGAANRITVQKLFSDSLTNGTFASVNLTGTITSNRTVATSATITTGTIPNLTAGTTTSTAATITNGTIPTLTAGTTTSTAGIFTSGTIATLNSTTPTFLGAITASTNTINVGSGQIYKDASGNVGIGTTSNTANSKLEVYGNSAPNAHIGIRVNNAAADGFGTLWLSNNGSNDGVIRGGASAASFTNQLAVITSGAIPVTIATNNTERLRIASDGQIGIGGANYGTSGQVLTSAGTSSAPSWATNPVGFRNRIINGDMRIDQRSSGASYAVTTVAAYGSCDRWGSFSGANGVWSQQRVTTGSTDFPFATRVQRTAGSTSTAAVYIGQVIETTNCQDLAGQTITLSYYATAGANFSAASSSVQAEVWTGTGSDQGWSALNTAAWTGQTLIINSTQPITTTRTRYSVTAAVPAGVKEIAIRFYAVGTGTAGANDFFQILGVQLEAGSTATEFERRPIGTETMLCQRYYELLSATGTGQGAFANSGYGATSGVITQSIMFKATKRTTPTIAIGGTWGVTNSSQPSVYSQADGMCVISITVTTTGQYSYIPNTSDDVITASSEL